MLNKLKDRIGPRIYKVKYYAGLAIHKIKDCTSLVIRKLKDIKDSLSQRSYMSLKYEWEEQNETIDTLTSNIYKLDRRYKKLVLFSCYQTMLYTKVTNENKKLKDEIKKLKENKKIRKDK